jgi:hypothetical protein
MFKGLRFYVGEYENSANLVLWMEAIDLEDPCRHLENKTELFGGQLHGHDLNEGFPKYE